MIDDPCDEWPCLQDMTGLWHVKVWVPLFFNWEATRVIMEEIMAYFQETGYA